MEGFRECPICFEVPEKEIYQCPEGHTVCNVCISKLTECPTCRTKYKTKRIRSRVLEALLDGQEFECKFSEKGCNHLCRRSELSNHANSCEFNTDLIPLCRLLGWGDCRFRIDACGGENSEVKRAEIVNHFLAVHQRPYSHGKHLVMAGVSIKSILVSSPEQRKHMALLWGMSEEENSPLFLVILNFNSATEFLSVYCIQIWGAELLKKYRVDFSFGRVTPSRNYTSTDVLKSRIHKLNPLLIAWALNVYTPGEAEYILKSCPVGIHKSILADTKFGDSFEDALYVDISLLT
ncbi:unnamed protein product [Orchesella dallaii]|uniref:RING-type domain-containing protein n=1 Tax=Orchesella dallaii TaxID=48710 RepID=A0ABP1RLD8_9HEXA